MDIQFFGHSIFAGAYKWDRENNEPKTLVEIINDKYGIKGKYIVIPTISEERILMEVKKYKLPMDFAVISHADTMNTYFPSWNHDFEDAKIPEENVRYWSENKKDSTKFIFTHGKFFTERTMNHHDHDYMMWYEVHEHLKTYKRLHYNPELQKNRTHGALMLLNDYLKNRNIKVIHLIDNVILPHWFKFTHGIVDDKILRYQLTPPYSTSYSKSLNAINEEGNIVAADKIIEYIENYEKYAIEFSKGDVT